MADETAEQKIGSLALAFIHSAKAKAQGGLTVAEFGSLVVELLKLLVVGLESVPLEGAAKKAWALSIVAVLFDNVAGYAVPVYLQPIWLVTKPAIRALVLAAAGGALEQILSITRAQAPEAAK